MDSDELKRIIKEDLEEKMRLKKQKITTGKEERPNVVKKSPITKNLNNENNKDMDIRKEEEISIKEKVNDGPINIDKKQISKEEEEYSLMDFSDIVYFDVKDPNQILKVQRQFYGTL